jgi:hypothetical protein
MAELRVLRGKPDAAELAALVVALAVVRPPAAPARPSRRAWADCAAAAPRRPGAWRRSGLPS